MLTIGEYVDIRAYTTFKVGGQFRYFTEINDKKELLELYKFTKNHNVNIYIIGGGSNIIFPDGIFNKIVSKINISGFEIISDKQEYIDIKIGAGENWDSVVKRTVDMNLSGIEALSSIPGTIGATPVQNVGAYGQEINNVLTEVEVFDISKQDFIRLSNSECNFHYRDSIFKHSGKNKYIIVSVTIRLSKLPPIVPNYPGVQKYFLEKNITNPSLLEIRNAIINIRSVKLPNPKEISNVGSFFKNPIVDKNIANKLAEEYPHIVTFPVDENFTKVPAGFLIESVGLKGKDFGTISVYKQNALVLVNNSNATFADVIKAKDEIVKIVFEKFGITLETEPEFV